MYITDTIDRLTLDDVMQIRLKEPGSRKIHLVPKLRQEIYRGKAERTKIKPRLISLSMKQFTAIFNFWFISKSFNLFCFMLKEDNLDMA